MIEYSLQKAPNLWFEIELSENRYTFHVKEFRGVMYCSVSDIDNEYLCASVRCLNKEWILPTKYNSSIGNFRFEDNTGEYPNYKNYGISCFLYYYTPEEISEIL